MTIASCSARDNPEFVAFKALESTYSESNLALIAIAPEKGSVFTREVLTAVEELTEAAWHAPYASRVDSLTNYSHSRGLEDDLIVEPLVEDAQSLSRADLVRIEEAAQSSIDIAGRLVSHDGRVCAIAVNFILPSENVDSEVVKASDYIEDLLEQARAKNPGISYYLTGDMVLSRTFSDATKDDFETLAPITFLIIIIIAAFLLRSVLGTAAIITLIVFILNTTLGFAGWLGTVFNPANAGVPVIVMAISVAHSVHIITTVLSGMGHGLGRNAAIRDAMRNKMYPVFLT